MPPLRSPRQAPLQHAVVRSLPLQGTDEELLDAFRRRHRGAHATIFDRYAPHVERVLMRVLGNSADVPDLLQEVFLQVFRAAPRLREWGAMQGWVTAIAVMTARQHIRTKQRKRWLSFLGFDALPEIEAPPASSEAARALRITYRLLDHLPVDERITFVLRRVEEMDLLHIAQTCGVSLSTVKRRIHRADTAFAKLARTEPELEHWLRSGTLDTEEQA